MRRFLWALLAVTGASAQDALDGQWALDLPNHEVGWLSVESGQVELLWGVGSARPVEKFELKNNELVFERSIKRPLAPKEEAAPRYRITVTANGESLSGSMELAKGSNNGVHWQKAAADATATRFGWFAVWFTG